MGPTPPTTNTARQPQSGISSAAVAPPSAAPTDRQQAIIITRKVLLRAGLYSLVRASALGKIAPRPMPVKKRSTSNASTDGAKAVASVAAPEAMTAPISTGRRPMRSASVLRHSEPITMPTRLAEKIGPSADGATDHSWRMAGAT